MTVRRQIILLLTLATLTGALVAGIWYKYQLDFERHLTQAYEAGVVAHALVGTPPTNMQPRSALPFQAIPASPERIISADNSVRLRFAGTDTLNFATALSISGVRIRVFSSSMQYSLAGIKGPPAAQFGQLFRSLAAYCGDPLIFIEGRQGWLQIKADALFGCAQAPPDWRTPTLILALIALATLLTLGLGFSEQIATLANAISARAKDGRTTPLPASGPPDLRAISSAINRFFDRENQRHARRATLLSGISHDLGTPTQRLKLRSALIKNQALRAKFDADIDQMTSMIDSVLAYTRNEMDVEETRKIPILSLLEAVKDDYADLGRPVTLTPYAPPDIRHSKTVFTAAPTRAHSGSAKDLLLCRCRPNAIRRALTNLIDNALKYGKSATLGLSASADIITITVQDEGTAPLDFTPLTEPFQRGPNARHRDGTGLGLTIVESIATSHGGGLSFAQTASGTLATLTLAR